ncbi:hypothetical protein ABDK56_06655 [Sphingomonas sp. ASV193]|uniref:hypothetical protein n=1 Tax=Sphingomonas sp. ASV193 TaxID=3144405 RepID=UPI0032E8766C
MIGLAGLAAMLVGGCARSGEGDYFDLPPAQVLVQLAAMDVGSVAALPGDTSSWRDGDSIHWAVDVAGQRIAAYHATVSADGDGSRIVLVEDSVEPVRLPSGGSAAMDKVNADVGGILASRLNRDMARDYLREKIASTLDHRPMNGFRVAWSTGQRIQRDASLLHDFADRVDEMQTDALKASFEAQKAEAAARSDAGEIERSYRDLPGESGLPNTSVGRPTLDTRPTSVDDNGGMK